MAEDLYVERLRYFNHQFLRLEDFETEQDYHLQMRREHNRQFHTWGVAGGLEVQVGSDRQQIRITPGTALDAQGREIVLPSEVSQPVTGAPGDVRYVTIAYDEVKAGPTTETGPEEYRRWKEVPKIALLDEPPADPSLELVLGVLTLGAGGTVGTVAEGSGAARRRTVGAVSPELRALRLVALDGDAQRLAAGGTLRPLRVMLANASGPVTHPGVQVRFRADAGSGTLEGGEAEVTLSFAGEDGTVSCAWAPDPNAAEQGVTATLIVPPGTDVGTPTELRFHASVEAARFVAFDPGSSAALAGKTDVQSAITALSQVTGDAGSSLTGLLASARRVRLVPLAGDAQQIVPGGALKTLQVQVADLDGPVRNTAVRVRFQVTAGSGRVSAGGTTTTTTGISTQVDVAVSGTDGTASCTWIPDATTAEQEVTATLIVPAGMQTAAPAALVFRAARSTAGRVAFDPGASALLGGKTTVQDAVATLGQTATDTSTALGTLGSTVTGLGQTAKRMRLEPVAGGGQQIVPGGTLKALQVLVADADGPVRNSAVKVRFQVTAGSGTVNGLSGMADVAVSATDGTAACTWVPDAATDEQEVTATLVAPSGTSVSAPTALVFRAARSTAARTGYTPASAAAQLAGKTTVQDALDTLGSLTIGAEKRGMRITQVRRSDSNALVQGADVSVVGFLPSLQLVFDRAPDPASMTGATCFFTVELPFPLDSAETALWGSAATPVAYRQMVVPTAPVARADGVTYDLTLSAAVRTWFNNLFTTLGTAGAPQRVRVRLTLQGNQIWASTDRDTYLDGGVMGGSSGLRLADDRRRGPDFETWFTLIPSTTISYPMYTYVYGYPPTGGPPAWYYYFTGIGTRQV